MPTLSLFRSLTLLVLLTSAVTATAAEPLVPGTGKWISRVGDDFEDENWKFYHNFPKSTYDDDENQRFPTGRSKNGRWFEGPKRGQPDIIRRVKTPPGGPKGSTHALELRTLRSGFPNSYTYKMQQDDFIASVQNRMGGSIPVSRAPSVVTHVYLPPIKEWENRTGPTFAFRVALETRKPAERKGLFSAFGPSEEDELYWPGMFICLESETDKNRQYDSAYIRVRAARNGGDFKAKQIKQTGWWTLGISVTPDGRVHYYASPGVDPLTHEDYITTQYPYGYRALRFKAFFYNVCNRDDGKTWSTSWIIDDPKLYLMH